MRTPKIYGSWIYLFNNRKYIGLKIVVSVSTYTNINFTRIGVSIILSSQVEDCVRSRLRDLLKERDVWGEGEKRLDYLTRVVWWELNVSFQYALPCDDCIWDVSWLSRLEGADMLGLGLLIFCSGRLGEGFLSESQMRVCECVCNWILQ